MKIKLICNNRKVQIAVLFLICILAEVFFFNANSFRLIFRNNYEQKTYTAQDVILTNAVIDPATQEVVLTEANYLFVELKNINTQVGTIYFSPESEDDVLEYEICYTDETNAEYCRYFVRERVKGVEKTNYMTCHFDGVSSKLILRFGNLEPGFRMSIGEIKLNQPVPFDFSVTRFLIFFSLLILLWSVRHTDFWLQTQKGNLHNLILTGVFVAFVVVGAVLRQNSIDDTGANGVYNARLVDALEQGKVTLDIPIDDKLLNMENPYDTSLRSSGDVDYSWDTAFYNGQYYCYYGVVPAILFYLPYKLLTGHYLAFATVTAISYSIYLFFLDVILIWFIRRLFPTAAFGLEFLSLCMTNAVSNIFVYMTEPVFYRMLYAVGMMFVGAGMFCFVTWYLVERKRRVLLFLGGLFLALSVGCRPPLLAYTVLLIPFGILYLREQKKKSVPDMLALLLPYIVVGASLAAYNYIRFDSITEFGQAYQLTAQDQLHSQHSLMEIPILLWFSVFQPLSFRAAFPYVIPGDPIHNYSGQFYQGARIVSLFGQAPLYILLLCPFVWKLWKKKKSAFSYRVLMFANAFMFVLLTFELLNAGVEWRYTTEMIPIFAISTTLLICNMMEERTSYVKTVFLTGYSLSMIFSLGVAFLRAVDGVYYLVKTYHPEFYYGVERLFSFWK